MITLEEKRLRELEGRIPVYEATIAELKKKLDEVNAFPKDIVEVKEKINGFRKDLDHLYNSYNERFNEIYRKTEHIQSNFLSNSQILGSHQGLLDSLNSMVNMLSGKANDHKSQLEKIRIEHCDTHEKVLVLDRRIDENHDALAVIIQRTNEISSKANNAQIDATAALNKMAEHENNLKALKASMQVAIGNLALAGEDINKRIDAMPSPVSPVIAKSYDAEIAEIRKDIASILSVVHVTATQAPDNTQVNEKIKTMEQAIAQVYGLLKKYEQR